MGATPGGRWVTAHLRRTGEALNRWQRLRVVAAALLRARAHEFVYYRTKEAYLNQEMPCKKKVFTLSGYEDRHERRVLKLSLCP